MALVPALKLKLEKHAIKQSMTRPAIAVAVLANP
jgi:hypothetical protein